MIKRFFQIAPFAVASLLIISVSSCLKPVSYPDEPILETIDYREIGDSLELSVTFTDGDGDIGLNSDDTTGDFNSSSFYHFNVYVQYFEKMNGTWVKGTFDPGGNNSPLADSVAFAYRIKNLTPIGQNKTLKGTIKIVIEPLEYMNGTATYYNGNSNFNDTVKFSLILIDRALNISNTIETEEILTH
jgi:hypothetical protein